MPHGFSSHPLTFYPAWCKRCGLCAAFCPRQVLELGANGFPFAARPERCSHCRLCELRCPDFAISVEPKEPGENP